MRVWGDEPQDARELAARMGIEHYVADERIPFKETIVKNFIDEYKQGRTPNPCVMCNPLFKFRVLAERRRGIMTAIFEKIAFYWTYPFVRYALIVGVLIALCSSLLGVTLVLKRFSFIGDGLSHVAFGAMAIAAVLGLTDDMPLTLEIGRAHV